MKELLNRIEKLETLTKRLEQAIQDIWTSCPCLTKELDKEDDIIYCPEPELPEEEEELPPNEIIDHDD